MDKESAFFDEGGLEFNQDDYFLEINSGGALYNSTNPYEANEPNRQAPNQGKG